ncbi:MAG: threonylcarbamoyl-AMP synthase [Candidatus Aenigmarchaeota archaeon]|nr:threonylcarbamoyl-AMP synthase [Candidatus Aenigmarchaeota archaeon]
MDDTERAIGVLKLGGVIAYPTDTVYGLGANIFDENAIRRVFEVKRRPLGKPISVMVSGIEMLERVAYLSPENRSIAKELLPGPVTLILPATEFVSTLLTGGTGTIGVRWIESDTVNKIILGAGFPITATSANLAGGSDAKTPEELAVEPDFVLTGNCGLGQPSTVVDLVGKRILREGAGLEKVKQALEE